MCVCVCVCVCVRAHTHSSHVPKVNAVANAQHYSTAYIWLAASLPFPPDLLPNARPSNGGWCGVRCKHLGSCGFLGSCDQDYWHVVLKR